MGVAIGDAMGMPWELMTPEEISAATKGNGVNGFANPVQRKIKGTAAHRAGETTDDWQLTAAITRSLVMCGSFDTIYVAREHVVEFDRCQFGWGGTTKTSLRNIKKWFDSRGHEGQNPCQPAPDRGPGKGSGNGVAMKVAPLGLFFQHEEDDAMAEAIADLGLMTHSDPRAWITAYLVARVIADALYTGYEIGHQKQWGLDARQLVVTLMTRAAEFEEVTPFGENGEVEGKVTGRCLQLASLIDSSELYGDAAIARRTFGTGCFCMESVPFALATFLRHPTDFKTGVLEAVNAGGDTDSTASMVGAMIGANVGIEGIPPAWCNFNPKFQEAIDLSQQLFEVVTR